MLRTEMHRDSAQWICNSLYAVMIGFVVSAILFLGDFSQYSCQLTFLGFILLLYYVIDWLSYNAMLDYDPKQEHIEVFLTIVFVILLGWLSVLGNFVNDSTVCYFAWGTVGYIVVTTVLSTLRLRKTRREYEERGRDPGSFSPEFKINLVDVGVRLVISAVFLVYMLESIERRLERLKLLFVIGFCLIFVTKFVRYEFVLLPLVRKARPQDKAEGPGLAARSDDGKSGGSGIAEPDKEGGGE